MKENRSQVLTVHVDQATYLGNVLTSKGTLDETINQRYQKALGISTQISTMLSSVYLGNFHFDTSMLMRDANFSELNYDQLRFMA